jgi:hypothetical protein
VRFTPTRFTIVADAVVVATGTCEIWIVCAGVAV